MFPTSTVPAPGIDPDGKRRIFGHAVFSGRHGAMLRELGFHPDDESNIIPDASELERRIKRSLAEQDVRRTAIEAELLRNHGHNAIRPFFVLAEPVFTGPLGPWLMRAFKLMPYDDWNVVYLPLDRPTQEAMGGLPLHPLQSIGPIDELMCKQIGAFYDEFRRAKQMVDKHVAQVGIEHAMDVLGRFVDHVEGMRGRIISHVEEVRPIIIALIADVQANADRSGPHEES